MKLYKKLFLSVIMSLLLSLIAFADTSKVAPITSLEVERTYKREVMDIPEEAFVLEIPTWHVTYDYKIIGEPELYDPITFEINVYAEEGYDFHGLKIASCKSNCGTFKELELSDDRKIAYITFLADPPEIILAKPENLRWSGSKATWDPVEYATEYELTLHYITNKGKISSSKLSTVTTNLCSYDFSKELYKHPRDYIFTVTAHPDPSSSFLKSSRSILDFEKSQIVTEEELGIYDGRWQLNKEGQKCYSVNGTNLTDGLYRIEGYYYLLADDGAMQYGWQLLDDIYYYFDPVSGVMVTGLNTINDNLYMFDDRGRMLTGWQSIDGTTYYAAIEGNLLKGWQIIEGNAYYFFEDGHLNKSRSLLAENKTLCTFDTKTGKLISTFKVR